jgi:uncharacterized protein
MMVDRFYEILAEEFKKLDLMKDNLALYDKYFTIDEIKGLIEFYKSPVGQKAIQVLPALTQEAMSRGMEQGRSVGPRAAGRFVTEFPEMRNVLGPPPER